MLQAQAYDLLRILVAQGCADWVIAPGSRSAPLVLALARMEGLSLHVMGDERAAGYAALGMAAATGQPVGVVVTSGTAVLNLAPAVAEAHLSNLPLLLLTADRPPEAIGQQDGQAIHQPGVFGQNVKAAFALPVGSNADDLRLIQRLANEAALLATTHPKGPVQLNVPFREPFYPEAEEAYDAMRPVPVWRQTAGAAMPDRPQLVELLHYWQGAGKRLIVAGTGPHDSELRNALKALLYYAPDVALAADPTSNLADLATVNLPLAADFGRLSAEAHGHLEPELIVHIGGPLTSRKLRHFLRGCTGAALWRVQPYAYPAPDPFYRLKRVVVAEPAAFITRLGEHSFFEGTDKKQGSYAQAWEDVAAPISARLETALSLRDPDGTQNEAAAALAVLQSVPAEAVVHLANSMPVRWAQWLWMPEPGQRVWANRGASGIDGCTATAVGYARKTDLPVLLLTGETAFQYDRNGLWCGEPLPKNLRIVVLNNGGGVIFRLIDGPANLPERDRFFENRHGLTAASAAQDFGLAYHACREVTPALLQGKLWEVDGPALLEVFCDPAGAEGVMAVLRAFNSGGGDRGHANPSHSFSYG